MKVNDYGEGEEERGEGEGETRRGRGEEGGTIFRSKDLLGLGLIFCFLRNR